MTFLGRMGPVYSRRVQHLPQRGGSLWMGAQGIPGWDLARMYRQKSRRRQPGRRRPRR